MKRQRRVSGAVTVRPSRDERSVAVLTAAVKTRGVGVGLERHERRQDHAITGQPKVIARREVPLLGRRSDRIVPTPWVASPLCASVPMEVEGGRFVGCSVAIEGEREGGRAHGLTERLPGAIRCGPMDSAFQDVYMK